MAERFKEIYSSLYILVGNLVLSEDLKVLEDVLKDIDQFLDIDEFESLEKSYEQVGWLVKFLQLINRFYYVEEFPKNSCIEYFHEINRRTVEYADKIRDGVNNFAVEKVNKNLIFCYDIRYYC